MSWIIGLFSSVILRNAGGWLLRTIGNTLGVIGTNDAQIAVAQIQAEIEARKAAREIRLVTSSFWEMRLITALIAGSFTLHLVAVTLDTVFHFAWDIPKYPAPFDEWEGAILLSFFGVQGASIAIGGIVAAITRRFK